ncbi:MAG TPA: ATP-binding protein [Chloroflexota bacterium]|nr:ATP-binding protein [Chloroflexota bacterium]
MYHSLPADDPRRWNAFPCECTQRQREERRRQRLLAESGLGALSRMTFDAFEFREGAVPEDQSKNLFAVWDAVRAYAEKPWPDGWFLLNGQYGCGKTHLAAAAVNHRIAVLSRPALLVGLPDLLDHLRSTFNPSSEVEFDSDFERVKRTEFVVLDDFGAEYGTPWATEKLYQLVNHRYNNQLPTIFTTNVEPERIEPRIRSRLLDQQLTEKWVIQAPDYRLNGPAVPRGNAHPTLSARAMEPAKPRRARRAS